MKMSYDTSVKKSQAKAFFVSVSLKSKAKYLNTTTYYYETVSQLPKIYNYIEVN